MKAAVGFLHAGEKSREATVAALARRGKESAAVHLVDPSLVDASAREFPIDDARYGAIRRRAEELQERTERIVLTCSVYNGIASWLADDLGIRVDRSDAAGARALLAFEGPVGVLVSYPPTRPIVVDYLSEVLAGAEQAREIRASVTHEAPPFATPDAEYRRALLEAMRPLEGCGVLFLAQFTMSAYLDALHTAWGARPVVSALESTLDALFTR